MEALLRKLDSDFLTMIKVTEDKETVNCVQEA
jgi:hypothetical protein